MTREAGVESMVAGCPEQREGWVREVLDSIQDFFHVIDREWRFVFVNHQFAALLDRPASEIVGQNVWDLLSRHVGKAVEENYRAAMERREVRRFEVRGEYTPGYYNLTVYPTPEGIAVLGVDMTERQRHESNLAFSSEVSRELAQLTGISESMQILGVKIGEHFRATNVAFGEVDAARNVVTVIHEWHRPDSPSWLGPHHVSDRDAEFWQVCGSGGTYLAGDAIVQTQSAQVESSVVAVPLVRDGRWRFTLSLGDHAGRVWHDQEIELLRDIATRIWARVERARAEAALRISEGNFALLATVSERLSQPTDLDDTLRAVSEQLGAHLHAARCGFGEVDEADHSVTVTHEWRRPEVPSALGVHRLAELHVKGYLRACRDGEAYVVRDLANLARPDEDIDALAIRSFVTVPLVRNGEWRFVSAVCDSVPRDWRDDEIDLIRELTYRTWARLERHRDREALRASEERFRALVNASSDLVFRMNPDWSEMRQLRGTGGMADTEAPSRRWLEDYIHPEDRARVIAAIGEAIRAKSIFHTEHRILRGDGSVGWTLSRAVPIVDDHGAIVEWFGAASDVSERRRVEEELREADRRKNAFLGVLSHELRNPLSAITNSLYILGRAATGSERAVAAQAVIGRQVSQLSRLVDDLLDITRITQNKIKLQRQRVELNELVQRAIEDHHAHFEHGEIGLTFEPADVPVFVFGDASRLAQVVGNLLQNAAKFTLPGGTTTVAVSTDATTHRAIVEVADTGVGLTPDVLARLFQPFVQADVTLDRSQGGLGLGLAVVKGLVELHGGAITAHSGGPGRGARFVVRIPLEHAQLPVTRSAARPGTHPGHRRVLVIEDNIDAAETLRQVLELGEHEVEVAHNGPNGIAKAHEFRPEVILCDIGLPTMSGYEVARALRSDDQLVGTFLVALSGYALPEDLVRAKEAGFDRHLAKPLDLEKLERMLSDLPPANAA